MATKRERVEEVAPPALTFEQALAQLEAVVRTLEDGQIGLDESLAKYEEGVRLLKTCRESLQMAERKIMLLTGIDADGNPIVEPFSEDASTLEEKKEARVRRRSRTVSESAFDRDESSDDTDDAGDSSDSNRQRGLF